MKELVTKTYKYEAVDGEVFETKELCQEYEASLPRHLVYCLTKKINPTLPCDPGVYEFGTVSETRRQEWNPGGFLQEAGSFTVTDTHYNMEGRVYGTLSDAIFRAVQNERFWNAFNRGYETYLKELKVEGL